MSKPDMLLSALSLKSGVRPTPILVINFCFSSPLVSVPISQPSAFRELQRAQ